MKQQSQPPYWVLASIFIFVILVLVTVGIILIYNGIHHGIIHQEIVSRPPPGKGGGMAAYGARAVKIGIGLAALGMMFIYGAATLFWNMYKGRFR
jgi:hypothetical protein